jgi:hypothetical protein
MHHVCPDRWDSLRIVVTSSVVIAAIGLLIGPLIITIINLSPCRSIGGRSRNCHGFDTGRPLLLRLIVVVKVVDDDDLAVTRQPKDVPIEVAEKLSGEFLIARSINNEQRRCNKTSNGDSGGGGDPDSDNGGVFASSGRRLPSAEGERSRLMPLLSSIGG